MDGQLFGILLLMVHTSKFIDEVMNKVAREFTVGRTEESVFTYVGFNIETTAKRIILDQIKYMKERMEPTTLRGKKRRR